MQSSKSDLLADFLTFRLKPTGKDLYRTSLVLLLFGVPFLYGYFWESRWLKVVNIDFGDTHPLRILHLSDIHFKGDIRYLNKIVDTINRQEVDFVCHAGDLLENSRYLDDLLEALEKIRHPVYAVPGNHEVWGGIDLDRIDRTLKKTGGSLLVNQSVRVKGGFSLVGLDSLLAGNPDAERSVKGTEGTKRIFLFHEPKTVELLKKNNFVLALAGHSHGGQVRIPFFGALVHPVGVGKYDRGFYQTEGGPLFVTQGAGTWGINVRFFCRPEIVVFQGHS